MREDQIISKRLGGNGWSGPNWVVEFERNLMSRKMDENQDLHSFLFTPLGRFLYQDMSQSPGNNRAISPSLKPFSNTSVDSRNPSILHSTPIVPRSFLRVLFMARSVWHLAANLLSWSDSTKKLRSRMHTSPSLFDRYR